MNRSKQTIVKRKLNSAMMEVLEPRQMFSGYAVSDLGLGSAHGINDNGEVVGNIPDASGGSSDAAYWTSSGQEYDLSWGGAGGAAYAINNSGEIVGFAYQDSPGGVHAFRLNVHDHTKIGGTDFTYGDDSTDSTNEIFTAIDNSFIGLTVGYSYSSGSGIFYNGDNYTVAGLPGTSSAVPLGIGDYNSSNGDTPVVGQSAGHAFYNSGATTVDITDLYGPSSDTGEANAVSPDGNYVVGDTENLPFVYYSQLNEVVPLSYGTGSATAVNDNGEVVGNFSVGNDTHAFYDELGQGFQDLNSLLPANSGWDLQDATGINASGEICGSGTFDGQQSAFELTPDTQGPTVDAFDVPANITSQTTAPAAFSVAYDDPFGVQTSSLKASDFTVTGPSGKTAAIQLESVDTSGDPTYVIASWNVTAPGGTWNNADNGTYTVSLNSDSVEDSVANTSPAQTLFSFNVNVPIPATAPKVSSLTVSPNSVVAGTNTTLTANGVSDVNNNVTSVSFYRESNGKPGLQTGTGGDTFISTDTSSSGGWTASASTSGLKAGSYAFYAEAKDSTNLISNVVSANLTVSQAGSLSGTVFNDNNGNGAKDSNDQGLSGWRVYLDTNKDGVFETSEKSVITSSTGSWSFSNLPLGTYRVREVPQSGWRLTTPSSGYYDITLTSAAANVTAKLFGDTKSVAITGNVFADSNSNGKKDSTEKGVSGWTVYLDTNNDGKLETGEKSVVTDANGNFSFTGLTAGTYIVRVVAKSGSRITDPASGNYLLTLASGTLDSILFGEH